MRFDSPQGALKWAYETTSQPIVKTSSINGMRGAERPSSSELTPHDRHAQAAFIMTLCERVLSPLHMAYIAVQYGREASGFDLLVGHLAANAGTGVHNRRAIQQIIRAYCGEKIGLREIRKSYGGRMLHAAASRNRAYDALGVLHAQSMARLDEEMRRVGLIESGLIAQPGYC